MALPLILGMAGSALAPTIGMTPFIASSIGSGLGRLIEGGTLDDAIGTGLMTYFGGKALGGVFGAGAGAGAPEATANTLSQATPFTSGTTTGTAMSSVPVGGIPSISQMPADAAASSGIFGTPAGAKVASTGLQGAMDAVTNPYTLGSLGTAGIMEAMRPPETDFKGLDDGPSAPEAEAAKRQMMNPDEDYRPGIDPEFNYFRPMQEGGIADLDDRSQRIQEVLRKGMNEQLMMNDKELISKVVTIIKSADASTEIPEEAKMILGQFLNKYGEQALRDLAERVQSGEFDQNAMVDEGMVNGAGDGMDDMIPATLEGEQDVVLSDGEFIVPADVVSGLGNGSSDAGAKSLYEMMDRVREVRTGMTEQPEQVPQGMMLPA